MATPFDRMASLGLLSPQDRQSAALNGLLVLGSQLANRGAPRLNPTPPPIDLSKAMNVYQTGMRNAMAQNMAVRKLEQEKKMRDALGGIDVSQLSPKIQEVFKAIVPYDPSAAVSLVGKTLTARQGQTAAQRNFAQLMTMYTPEELRALTPEKKRELFSAIAIGNLHFQNLGDRVVGLNPASGKPVVSMPKGISPEQEPELKRRQSQESAIGTQVGEAQGQAAARTIEGSDAEIEAKEKKERQDVKDIDRVEGGVRILEYTGEIKKLFANSKAPWALSGTASVPGGLYSDTPAGVLRSYVESLKSPVVLGAMLRLKDASASGATGFGQMNLKELQILIDQIGALNPNTTNHRVFLRTVNRIEGVYKRIIKRVQDTVPREDLERLNLQGIIDGVGGSTATAQPQPNQTPLQTAIDKARAAIARNANPQAVLRRIRQTYPNVTLQDIQ